MTVNADFLISPAYIVPAIRISRRPRCTRMAVSDRVPSTSGTARNEGASMIVKFGVNPASSTRGGRMKRFQAKRLAHAVSV